MTQQSGADALCRVLEEAGVACVFGLPGTQTVGIYDALRRSRLRAIVATHELGAAFMAAGFARASGKVGVLLTIPGPGFAYALAGLAECKLDGTAVVHVTLKPARGPTNEPAFQAIDQLAIARPLVKDVFTVEEREELTSVLFEALRAARESEPGPVLVELSERLLSADGDDARDVRKASGASQVESELTDLVGALSAARRPVLLIASDCFDGAEYLADVASKCRMPICVPPPSRGIIPEDDVWSLCFDDQRTEVKQFNAFLALSDLVVVLGARLSHVTTAGFRLKLNAEHSICVTTSSRSLPHGYSARRTFHAEPVALLERLRGDHISVSSEWSENDLLGWRTRFSQDRPAYPPEPEIDGVPPDRFFSELRTALPLDAIVVTDSGLHQVMVRRHLPVLAARGLIFPSDFQSMGFGLAAAIGAKLAAPERPVVVIMGDGGFAMSGLELLTAIREEIPITVLVMNDGKLNLIRVQQLREFGRTHGVDLEGPDLGQLAAALGARYSMISGNVATVIAEALSSNKVTVIEVPVGDSTIMRGIRAKSLVRETARKALGPSLVAWIKRRLRTRATPTNRQ